MCIGCGRQIAADYNVCPHCGRQQGTQSGGQPQPYAQQQFQPVGGIRYLFYLLSFFSLLIGFVLFLVWMKDPNPDKRRVGKNCLMISVVAIVLSILCWGVAAIVGLAFL